MNAQRLSRIRYPGLFLVLLGVLLSSATHALSFNFPPVVSNLSAPSSVRVNQLFGISYNYWDDDGLQDVWTHHVLMSDGTHYTQAAGGSGSFYIGDVWGFSTPGNHWIEVWVVDSIGQQSNHLRRNILVGGSFSAPVVSNLSTPSSVLVEERFGIRYNYWDADGLGDVRTHHVLMSDGSHTTFPAAGSGSFYAGDVWFFSTPGSHWVEVYVVDSGGRQSNHLRRNIQVNAPVVLRPDLIVSSMSLDTATAAPGQTLNLNATVLNAGSASSGTTTLRFYRSSDSVITAGDLQIGTSSVGALSAGGQTSQHTSVSAPGSEGNYWFGACVDNVSNESNTTNNCSAGAQVTVTQPPRPDLRIASISVNIQTPTPEQPLTLSARVNNTGNGTANSTLLRFYLSTDSSISTGDSTVGTASVESLASGATSASKQVSLTAPSSEGSYWLGACVDIVADETVTTNNCSAAVAITVARLRQPDLVVVNPAVDYSTPAPNQTLSLTAQVNNAGSDAANTSVLRFYRSTDADITTSDTPLGTASVAPLAAGALSGLKTVSTTAPASEGSYWLGACVDIVANEASTTNNCSDGVAISVVLPAVPDLAVPEMRVDNLTPTPGQALLLSARIDNTGSGAANSSVLRFYLSNDVEVGPTDTPLGTVAVEALPSGAMSVERQLAVSAPANEGTYWIGACVDIVAGETQTDNNCSASQRIVVAPPAGSPDLIVPMVTVSIATPEPNQSITLRITVQNSGDRASNSTQVRFYRSLDAAISNSDTFIGSVDLESLAASSISTEKSVSVFAPGSEGVYWLGACVDPVEGESDTSNNCSVGEQISVAGEDTDPTFVAGVGKEVRVAANATQTALTTINTAGNLIVFTDRSAHTNWSGLDLSTSVGGPKPGGMSELWFNPKDGLLTVAIPSSTGLVLYLRDAGGAWTQTNLTSLVGGSATPIVGKLTHYITPDLARDFDGRLILDEHGQPIFPLPEKDRNNVYVAGINPDGDLVVYYQQRDADGVSSAWRYTNITREYLVPNRQAIPAWSGDIIGYTTPWNGQTIAGLDAQGQIVAVWTAPDRNGIWATTNLSRSYGTPRLSGGLSAYVNWGISLTGVLPNGHLGVTWWSAQYEQEQRDKGLTNFWAFTDLGLDASGPNLQADTVANYTTPNWPSNNIVGITESNQLVSYWWTPDNHNTYGREWVVTNLSEALPTAGVPVGKLSAVAATDSTASVQGVAADGHVLRYFWSQPTGWVFQDVTDIVTP